MDKAYEASENDKGAGVKSRWYAYFKVYLTLLGDSSPYAQMAWDIQDAMRTNAQSCLKKFSDDVLNVVSDLGAQCEAMMEDLGNASDVEEARSALQDPIAMANEHFKHLLLQVRHIESSTQNRNAEA